MDNSGNELKENKLTVVKNRFTWKVRELKWFVQKILYRF